MIRLNKIGLSALAVLAMASCASTESSAGVKGYLLGQGFQEGNITQLSAEAYIKTQEPDFKADGLQEYLAGIKPNLGGLSTQFYCWFFDNADHASAFVTEHVASMYYSLEGRCEDPAMGSRNNAAWCGTKSLAVGMGWAM